MTQVPTGGDRVTTPEVTNGVWFPVLVSIVQPEVDEASTLSCTTRPEVAVALTAYVEPTRGDEGGEFETVIVWGVGRTVRVKVPVAPVALPSPLPCPWSLSVLVVVAVITHVPGLVKVTAPEFGDTIAHPADPAVAVYVNVAVELAVS